MAVEADIETLDLPEGVRVRKAGKMCFGFNYFNEARTIPLAPDTKFIIGEASIPPAGVSVWWASENLPTQT